MDEGLQRACRRCACSRVPTAVLAAAAFVVVSVHALVGLSSAAAQTAGAPASPRAAAEASSTSTAPARPRPPARRPDAATTADRAHANTVSIVAGGTGSTALAAVTDLAAVLDDGDAFRVLPIVGSGGAQTVRDVRLLKGIDLGIAPARALALLSGPSGIGRLDDKISIVTKLFNEEIHVLVRSDAAFVALADLAGRPVAIGEAGSGTALIARDVLDKLGVSVTTVTLPTADAMEKLRSGAIEAVVLLAGKPAPALARLPAGPFRLLPLAYAKPLQADYLPAVLSAADYPGLVAPGVAVETVAVGTVLFTPSWPKGSDRYKRIERFVETLFPKLAALQAPPRHPKWRETSLAATVPGFARFPAAEEWLRKNAPPPVSREQFDKFLASRRVAADDTATPADREKLFQEFLRWNETRERR
ncbi:TAXI family TRAP transporter solute-binding subunit [Rhodoplanes sp. SY1]|uniref:TAXI family TRAP transporter solute-binding subunit n=1 Tax=Rhodoplanes sp. SY1 TaxID=3166646 RepID=UPI0038B5B484